MAPDAPPPAYNSHGNEVAEWLVVAAFRPARDALTLSWTQDGTLYVPRRQGAQAYPPDDLGTFIGDVESTLRRLAAPRLW